MAPMLPRLFFQHFHDTSFIAETRGDSPEIAAFIVGFISQSVPDESYIHFVGVSPEFRKNGLGKMLYMRFFEEVRKRGCKRVLCVTSPVNRASIAFHGHMGFTAMPGDSTTEDGVPFSPDYDGPGEPRVCFVRDL